MFVQTTWASSTSPGWVINPGEEVPVPFAFPSVKLVVVVIFCVCVISCAIGPMPDASPGVLPLEVSARHSNAFPQASHIYAFIVFLWLDLAHGS